MVRRDIWFLVDHQLWPHLSYGLCSNTSSSFDDLTSCLDKQYWQLIPLGGSVRSAKCEIRQMSLGFYGAGCPHVGVESTIAQVNKLLMHFGCPSNLGLKMKVSLNYLCLEMGVSVQPLQESYKKLGDWVSSCWLKALSEKCDLFNSVWSSMMMRIVAFSSQEQMINAGVYGSLDTVPKISFD